MDESTAAIDRDRVRALGLITLSLAVTVHCATVLLFTAATAAGTENDHAET